MVDKEDIRKGNVSKEGMGGSGNIMKEREEQLRQSKERRRKKYILFWLTKIENASSPAKVNPDAKEDQKKSYFVS